MHKQRSRTYVALHNHSRKGSPFDGVIRIPEFVEFCKQNKMPAACLTDHGSMAGGYELFKECTKNGLKHLIGCELYVKEPDGGKTQQGKDYYHLTAIAINLEGYKNLCRLSVLASIGGRHGRGKKPCVTNEQVFAYSEGVVILSGCLSSELNQSLNVGNMANARKWLIKYRNKFKNRLFVELHCHVGIEKKWDNNSQKLVELGKEFGIKRIITNDAHFLRKEDWGTQTLALAVGLKKATTITSENLKKFKYTGEEYIKTREEISSHFLKYSGLDEEEIEDALDATLEVADMFEPYSLKEIVSTPKPTEESKELFRQKCVSGMFRRYGDISSEHEYWARLDYEMRVISDFGFPDYFLMVENLTSVARQNGYKIGPGRGSAAGSIVAYVLGITDLDPMRHGLMFERFLNPGRKSLPDIDVDIDRDGKDFLISYLQEKYGKTSAICIGTTTEYSARSAIKDAYRVNGLSAVKANLITKKYFAASRGIVPKLSALLEDKTSAFYKAYSMMDDVEKKAIDMARDSFEGKERGQGVHASGVAISKELADLVPLTWNRDGKKLVTEYDYGDLESMGIIKYDLLGLNNLSQELEIERLMKLTGKEIPTIDELGKYPEIYRMLQAGKTFGVFQLAQKMPTELLKEIDAKCFEDLSAVNALNRPGPIDSKSDRIYVKNRKNGMPPVHPVIDEILEPTFGMMLYQEQIMKVAVNMSGYSLAEADVLRKIIGKKLLDQIAKQEEKFVQGALNNGFDERLVNSLWNEARAASAYSFNKAHTYAYGKQALVSAYYKCYHPLEFWTAGITVNSDDSDKSAEFINEAKVSYRVRVPIFAKPLAKSWIMNGNEIVIGLANIKGIGMDAAIFIEENAPYSDFLDFCLRSGLNRAGIFKLGRLGFFSTCYTEDQLKDVIYKQITAFKGLVTKRTNVATGKKKGKLMEVPEFTGQGLAKYLEEKQFTMPQGKKREERTDVEIIQAEKELIGAIISVDVFADVADIPVREETDRLKEVIGIITGKRVIVDKNGRNMCFLAVQDRQNVMHDFTLFADSLSDHETDLDRLMQECAPVLITSRPNEWKGKTSYIFSSIRDLRDRDSVIMNKLREYADIGAIHNNSQSSVFGIVTKSEYADKTKPEWEIRSLYITVMQTDGRLKKIDFRDSRAIEKYIDSEPVVVEIKLVNDKPIGLSIRNVEKVDKW